MEKSKRSEQLNLVKAFKPNKFLKLLYIVLIGLFCIAFAMAVENGLLQELFSRLGIGVFYFLGVPIIALMLYQFYIDTMQALYVYKEGLALQYGKRRSFIYWKDLRHFKIENLNQSAKQGVRQPKKNKTRRIISIYCAKPLYERNTFERLFKSSEDTKILNIMPFITRIPLAEDKTVDLEKFKLTELGRLLYEYAPHLFEGELS
ncbi:MAG: hypothetical protein Phog2KO_32140 [Phototrophicaceae bacterium]